MPFSFAGDMLHLKEGDMRYYRITPEDDGDSYWIYAASEKEARKLVAMYCEPDATEEDLYGCILDDTHPSSWHRRL